jgi:hypothetical protein
MMSERFIRRLAARLFIAIGLLSSVILCNAMAGTKLVLDNKVGSFIKSEDVTYPPRKLPESKIIVCSTTPTKDILILEAIARKYLDDEHYVILNAQSLPVKAETFDATLVFFGAPTDFAILNECFPGVTGYSEAARLLAKLADRVRDELNERLKKQFGKSEDVALPEYCAPANPTFEIYGREFNWSIHLKKPSTRFCPMSYFFVFGINRVCLSDPCPLNEEEDALKKMNLFKW